MRQKLASIALLIALTACGGGGGNQAASDRSTSPAAVLQVQTMPSAIESSTTTASPVAAKAVDLTDAIAILKMIVGLDVNAGGAALSAYQAYAADVDGNGKVELSDAISVLKRIVGLETATANWMFFNGTPTVADKLNPGLPPEVSAAVSSNTSMTAVLRGDVVSSSAYTYSWALTSKPTGSSAAITDTSAVNPSFKADVAGSYVATMTITDGSKNVATSSVTLTACSATSSTSSPFVNCGGGRSSTTSLSGSISQGSPIAGAKITLIDAKGTVVDGGTSASDGSYAITDISSLTAPILIIAQATIGGKPVTYRSVLAQKGLNNTANVTPITDAVLAQTAGKSTALIEVNASSTLTNLDLSKLSTTTTKLVTAISNVLDQITAGTSASFNPFTSIFTADGVTAADRVNNLLSFTSIISSTGVTTEIIDKSNSVGSVTISDSFNATALPSLPQDVLKVQPQYLANFTTAITDAVSTPSKLDGSALENLFDSQFLDNGMIKSDILSMFRTEGRDIVLGAKFSNPKVEYCDTNNVCLIYITLKNTNVEVQLDLIVKYYPTQTKFLGYGNQFKFQANFGSSLKKEYDQSDTFTLRSHIQFSINSKSALWNKYQSAMVTLQSGSNAPDLTYNFILKPNYCSTSIGKYYDGMPLDDGTNNCDTWKFIDNSNQLMFKTINDKIKLGGYTAKFQVWKNANRSDTPDQAIVAITNPILMPDTLGADGYPRITVVQGTGGSLPYLSIDNADDYVVSGSLCISSVTSCDVKSTVPPAHTTVSNPFNTKLPSKYSAKSSDGWQVGEQAKSFFIHVIDKAGRDMMVQKN